MRNNKSVFRNIALITQLGIHMLTPVFLCVAAGVYIDNKFSTYFTLPLLIVGILAGARNAYRLAVASTKQDTVDENRGRARSMNLDRSYVRRKSVDSKDVEINKKK